MRFDDVDLAVRREKVQKCACIDRDDGHASLPEQVFAKVELYLLAGIEILHSAYAHDSTCCDAIDPKIASKLPLGELFLLECLYCEGNVSIRQLSRRIRLRYESQSLSGLFRLE